VIFPLWLEHLLEIAWQGIMPALVIAAVVGVIWYLRSVRRAERGRIDELAAARGSRARPSLETGDRQQRQDLDRRWPTR